MYLAMLSSLQGICGWSKNVTVDSFLQSPVSCMITEKKELTPIRTDNCFEIPRCVRIVGLFLAYRIKNIPPKSAQKLQPACEKQKRLTFAKTFVAQV